MATPRRQGHQRRDRSRAGGHGTAQPRARPDHRRDARARATARAASGPASTTPSSSPARRRVLHDAFLRQLKPGGRVFAVVGEAPVMTARIAALGRPRFASSTNDLFETVIAPLRNAATPVAVRVLIPQLSARRARRVGAPTPRGRHRCWSTSASPGSSTSAASTVRVTFRWRSCRRASTTCRRTGRWSSSATTATAASMRRAGCSASASRTSTTCAAAWRRGRTQSTPPCSATDSQEPMRCPTFSRPSRPARRHCTCCCARARRPPAVGRGPDADLPRGAARRPALAAAKAQWIATQERVPQALRRAAAQRRRSTAASTRNNYDATIKSDPPTDVNRNFNQYNATISASQPLFRWQNMIAYDQAKQQVAQADYVLACAQQDLIVRVAVAYFDVLLAEFNIELAEAQKARRVRAARAGQAQLRGRRGDDHRHQRGAGEVRPIVAQEIAARNDLDNRMHGAARDHRPLPQALKKLGRRLRCRSSPDAEHRLDYWVERAIEREPVVRVAQYNFDIATLEVERARAGHYPTLDLVGSYGMQGSSAGGRAASLSSDSPQRPASARSSTCRSTRAAPSIRACARRSRCRSGSRQDLESARRAALFNAQNGFSGVNSAVARSRRSSRRSSRRRSRSSRTGSARRSACGPTSTCSTSSRTSSRRGATSRRRYFNYLTATLRLKAAVGALTEADLEEINRRLGGLVRAPRARPAPRRARGASQAQQPVGRAAVRGVERRAPPRPSPPARPGRRAAPTPRRPARRHPRRRIAAPAASASAVASAKLNMCGPTSVGRPAAIGSIRFWPPSGSRLPPTKATSAAA